MRAKHSQQTLHILVAKSNSQDFTYDGIDVGGERVAREIEDELAKLTSQGQHITKLSVVGYSLGGLIARYSIGLLYSRGWFSPSGKNIRPVNFTAFASPFLGVRTPVKGYHSSFWNALGGRALSSSGQQLFLLDTFRDTGRPLLSLLADPNSIFVKALSCFKNRALYANIQNDRSAPYYTTYIDSRDPFEDLSAVDLHPLPDFSPTILDPSLPVTRKPLKNPKRSLWERLSWPATKSFFKDRLPLYAFFTILTPIAGSVFLLNSGYQTVRSIRRVRLHNDGSSAIGTGFRSYRIPLLLEGAVESMQAKEPQEHFDSAEEQEESHANGNAAKSIPNGSATSSDFSNEKSFSRGDEGAFPTLALLPAQFEMIRNLDAVGWRKYAVNIEQVRHTHAAIIVRMERDSFREGRVVIGHWVEEEFEI